MKIILYILGTFVLIYLISYLILVRKANKYNKRKIPVEVEYLIKKYNIDVGRLNYKKFLKQICLIGSIDMTIAVLVILPIKSIMVQILVGFVILIPIIYISFMIYGKYLIKKGYGKNEHKRNRK